MADEEKKMSPLTPLYFPSNFREMIISADKDTWNLYRLSFYLSPCKSPFIIFLRIYVKSLVNT